jgi:hypothetical protein
MRRGSSSPNPECRIDGVIRPVSSIALAEREHDFDIHFIQVIDAECVIFKHEGEFCDSDFLSAMGRIKAA